MAPPRPAWPTAGPAVQVLRTRPSYAAAPAALSALTALLDPEESARAACLPRAADRRRFVVGAALLHRALAEATGRDAREPVVTRVCPSCPRPHGRPVPIAPGWWCSVSHSADDVVVAVTPLGPVGVDVEAPADLAAVDAGTRRLALTPRERAWVEADPPAAAARWHRLWTGKEAVLKALGVGLPGLEQTELDVTDPDLVPVALPGGADPGGVRLRHVEAPTDPRGPVAVALVGPGLPRLPHLRDVTVREVREL